MLVSNCCFKAFWIARGHSIRGLDWLIVVHWIGVSYHINTPKLQHHLLHLPMWKSSRTCDTNMECECDVAHFEHTALRQRGYHARDHCSSLCFSICKKCDTAGYFIKDSETVCVYETRYFKPEQRFFSPTLTRQLLCLNLIRHKAERGHNMKLKKKKKWEQL